MFVGLWVTYSSQWVKEEVIPYFPAFFKNFFLGRKAYYSSISSILTKLNIRFGLGGLLKKFRELLGVIIGRKDFYWSKGKVG